MRPRIFLNYAREDRSRVDELRQALDVAGNEVWMDLASLPGGDDWHRAIEREIRQSDFFVACLTQRSVSKPGVVREEIELALDVCRERTGEDIFLIPVRLDDCAPPEELNHLNIIDLFAVSELPRLLESIHEGLSRRGVSILRREPNEYLLEDEAIVLHRALINEFRRGGRHPFTVSDLPDGKVLKDHSTGLVWQYGLSGSYIKFPAASAYIVNLNSSEHCGIRQWRLPTLEEGLSLGLCCHRHSKKLREEKFWKFWTVDTEGPIPESGAGYVWAVTQGWAPILERPLWEEAEVKCVSG